MKNVAKAYKWLISNDGLCLVCIAVAAVLALAKSWHALPVSIMGLTFAVLARRAEA